MNIKFTLRQLKEKVIYQVSFFINLLRNIKGSKSCKFTDTEGYTDDTIIISEKGITKSNMWGMFKIPSKYKQDYTQYIKSDGWIFCTPFRNYGVIGYPSITYDNNPTKVSNIDTHVVEYESSLEIEKNRKFNTSFDFWLSTEDKFAFPSITHEVMIWDNYFVSMPFGKFRSEVVIGGNLYRVYSGYIDKSIENLGTNGWEYICFLNVNRKESNVVDVKVFLYYLISNGYITTDHYLVRSEFGNEVYNASGKFNIDKFNVNIEKK